MVQALLLKLCSICLACGMHRRVPRLFLLTHRYAPWDYKILQVKLGVAAQGFNIGHTEERREELKSALQEVLENKTVEPKQAERLRGRMRWFEGYAFGRVAQFSLEVLGDLSPKKQKTVRVADHELRATELLVKRVAEARAIEISSVFPSTFLIFTDGACEGESSRIGSVGGVLVSPNGKCCQLTS